MSYVRMFVAAFVLFAAVPSAEAQTDVQLKRFRHGVAVHIRTTFGGYLGDYGGFYYSWPALVQRPIYDPDDFAPRVRALGLDPSAYDDTPLRQFGQRWPYVSTGGVDEAPAPKAPRVEAENAVHEGRMRWLAGDAAGALESFKRAVSADLKFAPAQLNMALALVATGDLKNADKAVRSALDALRGVDEITGLKIDELFRKPKDRARFEEKLTIAADGTGSLAVALAQHLLGRKAKAATILAGRTEPAAARLAALLQ